MAAPACPHADALPGQVSYRALGKATHCLVNVERRRHGRSALRSDGRLSRAARGHARDMVSYNYFGHTSRSGVGSTSRILRTGYTRGARRWSVGENIAWGADGRSTPRAILRAWMNSPSHRRNILSRRFSEVGVAAVPGAPVRGGHPTEATFVHDFGRVRP
ncbi:MAG: CAP domain-containing protein [Actinomycetota bacterium]|nr:CAP domain-containing protein [Actinomycetota bacterium]